MTSPTPDPLLAELEEYYDAVPRSVARVEQVGPFTLFVNPGRGMPYYARPSLGATDFSVDDVRRVRDRQRELGIPETFEWVAETTPALAEAAASGGLVVVGHPLMVVRDYSRGSKVFTQSAEVRLATVKDELALLRAIAHVAFGAPGTAMGAAGVAEAMAMIDRDPEALAQQQDRLISGKTVTALALVDGQPVGTGSHQPVGSVTELVGIAVLPAYRRRGIAAALTAELVDDALERGVRTAFLSAGDETIGRVYERVGFRRIATACAAEP